MFERFPTPFLRLTMLIMVVSSLWAAPFPDYQDAASFRTDLRRLSLLMNLPNINGKDDYIGLHTTINMVAATEGELQLINAFRLSVYPNPGYDLWVQLSRWSNTSPSFSVASGIQYEFPGRDLAFRRIVGLGWSKSYSDILQGRNVTVTGLLGKSYKRWEYGISTTLNLQHAIIEDGWGIPDYDETFYSMVPYIGVMIVPAHIFQLMLPFDKGGVAFSLAYEFQFGSRR